MSISFTDQPISNIETADKVKIANISPKEKLFLILPDLDEPVEVVFDIKRYQDTFYIQVYSDENWYGIETHRVPYLDWSINSLFKERKNALKVISQRLMQRAEAILIKSQSL